MRGRDTALKVRVRGVVPAPRVVPRAFRVVAQILVRMKSKSEENYLFQVLSMGKMDANETID